ncbi:MAG: restriction endonuclease subunit S, partial [Fluviicola sp.]
MGSKKQSELPSGWEIKKIKELGEIISGLTYKPEMIRENGILVLRSSNVQNRTIVFTDNVFVDSTDLKFNPVQEGDILICVRNGSRSLIGKNARIDKRSDGFAFGAFMSVFRSKHNDYLLHVFDTDIYNREIHINLGATINS